MSSLAVLRRAELLLRAVLGLGPVTVVDDEPVDARSRRSVRARRSATKANSLKRHPGVSVGDGVGALGSEQIQVAGVRLELVVHENRVWQLRA